jgi:uncharacterized protein YdaU (DUF1376 family)
MPALPYFPLYPKDIVSDFRMNELSGEERGLFTMFLMNLWIAENQLKDDDRRIARILSVQVDTWNSLKQQLIESGLLRLCDDGCLRNNRLTKEIEKSIDKCEKALKGASARWGKEYAKNKMNQKEERDDVKRDESGKPIIRPIYNPDDGLFDE